MRPGTVVLALVAACHATTHAPKLPFPPVRAAPPAGPHVGALDGNALDNVLLRYLAITAPESDTAQQVNEGFLAGDLRYFQTWAELVASGKLVVKAAATTPHESYFTKLAAAPARERNAVLGIMVAGRRAHAGLADPMRAPAGLVPCDGACQKWLVAYLAAFTAPALAVDPRQPMGETLTDHSRYPDELLVGLVGDYAIAGAIGDLERLVKVERRFYQLFTDYGTSPHEVGGLYQAALLALVKIGRAHTAQARAIAATLSAYAADLGKLDASGTTTVERVWRENNDAGGPGDEGSGPTVTEEPATAEDSKIPSLTLAVTALGGDDAAATRLGGAPQLAGFAWARAVDYEMIDALHRFPGAMAVAGEVLYYVAGPAMGAIDLATGDERWRNPLRPTRGEWPGQLSTTWIAVTPSGAPVFPAYVHGAVAGAGDRGTAFVLVLDPASGEIVSATPWGAGADTMSGNPDYFAVNADGAYLQVQQTAWKTAWGATRDPHPFRHEVKEGGTLRVAGDKIAIMGDRRIHIVGAAGATLVDAELDTVARAKHYAGEHGYYFSSSLTLTSAAFYFLSGDSTIYAADYRGQLLGKLKFEPLTDNAVRRCGDALCALGSDGLHILSGAQQTTVPLPANTRDFAADELGQAFLTGDETIVIITRGVTRTVDTKHAAIERIAALTPACVVVTTSADPQTLLACLPR